MTRRVGRKASRDYVSTWGEVIAGAYLGKDGRLRPIGKPTPAFGGDERMMVHRFRLWQQQSGEFPIEPLPPPAILGLSDHARNREYWRNLILTDPKAAALELDIPHLAHYAAAPPKPSLTLSQLAEQYAEKKRNKQGKQLDKKYRKNLIAWWTEFLEIAAKVSARPVFPRDVDRPMIQAFQTEILRRFDNGQSPAYVRSRFAAVKAILQFGIDYSDDKAECRRLLDECGILSAPAETSNPTPIRPEEISALLGVADARLKAMLLLGLNAGMHGGEVAKTLRADVDLEAGTLAARRTKNANPRVAKLWGRTVAAIREYQAERPHNSPSLFVSRTGAAMNGERLRQLFVTLRAQAGLPESLTFESIRDAALTEAATIDPYYAKLFAGHRTGQQDKYVLRQATNPRIIEICEAIEQRFFGKAAPQPKRSQKRA